MGYVPQRVCDQVDWVKVMGELSDHYPVETCLHLGGHAEEEAPQSMVSLPLKFGRPGDCAVVGFSAAHPDDFAVLLLAAMDADTKLFVTDSGVYGDGSLRNGEGVRSYTAATKLPAGTVLHLSDFSTKERGHMALST